MNPSKTCLVAAVLGCVIGCGGSRPEPQAGAVTSDPPERSHGGVEKHHDADHLHPQDTPDVDAGPDRDAIDGGSR